MLALFLTLRNIFPIQGFRLRPGAGHIVWSFFIPRLVLCYQYLGVLLLLSIFIQYNFTIQRELEWTPVLPEKRWKWHLWVLKISWGGMPPDHPRCLRLRRSQGALRCQDKFHIQCFHNHVHYFTKLLKTLPIIFIFHYLLIFIDQLIVRASIDVSFNYNLYTMNVKSCLKKGIYHSLRATKFYMVTWNGLDWEPPQTPRCGRILTSFFKCVGKMKSYHTYLSFHFSPMISPRRKREVTSCKEKTQSKWQHDYKA